MIGPHSLVEEGRPYRQTNSNPSPEQICASLKAAQGSEALTERWEEGQTNKTNKILLEYDPVLCVMTMGQTGIE